MSEKVVLVFDDAGRAIEVYRGNSADVDYHFANHKQGCVYRDITRLPHAWNALIVQPPLTEIDAALAALDQG